MRYFSKFVIVLSVFLVAGCQGGNRRPLSLGPAPHQKFTKEAPATRQKNLLGLRHWRMYGALSVNVRGKTRILSFNWYQKGPQVFHIKLNTSAGFYQVSLQNYYGKLTFWRTPTRFIRTESFRNMMLSELGWYLPMRRLFYWMRGVPLPKKMSKGKVITKYDQYGHLTVLGQNGFVIQYSHFMHFGGYDLPTKINIFGRHTEVRLAIMDWVLYFNDQLMDIPKTNEVLLKSL